MTRAYLTEEPPMRRFIAWTLTLAAGVSSVSISLAQTPRTAPSARPAASTPVVKGTLAPQPRPAPTLDPAAQQAKAATDARARNDMNHLLDEWEKQSAKVKSLQVVFERTDKSVKWDDKVSQGTAILKSPDLACLEFKRAILDSDGKPRLKLNANGQKAIDVEKEPYQRIVCTGKEVLQYEWDEKVLYIYPLDKEARQKALQQGPLPFLFNMKAAEARQRYSMTLVPDARFPKEYCIKVVPNEEIDKKDFKMAVVWLDKEQFQPSRLVLYPVGDKDLQEFRFTLIAPNKPIADAYFAVVIPDKWKVERNDNPDGPNPKVRPTQAAAPAGRPVQSAPNRVAGQPAPKGSTRP